MVPAAHAQIPLYSHNGNWKDGYANYGAFYLLWSPLSWPSGMPPVPGNIEFARYFAKQNAYACGSVETGWTSGYADLGSGPNYQPPYPYVQVEYPDCHFETWITKWMQPQLTYYTQLWSSGNPGRPDGWFGGFFHDWGNGCCWYDIKNGINGTITFNYYNEGMYETRDVSSSVQDWSPNNTQFYNFQYARNGVWNLWEVSVGASVKGCVNELEPYYNFTAWWCGDNG